MELLKKSEEMVSHTKSTIGRESRVHWKNRPKIIWQKVFIGKPTLTPHNTRLKCILMPFLAKSVRILALWLCNHPRRVSLLKLATAAAKKMKFSTSTLATVNLTQVPSRERPDGLLIKRLRLFIKIGRFLPNLTPYRLWENVNHAVVN